MTRLTGRFPSTCVVALAAAGSPGLRFERRTAVRACMAIALTLTCAAGARAQPVPASVCAASAPDRYASAFDGYRGYQEQPVLSWREANDTVRSVGGWRAYAREAAGSATVPEGGTAAATPVLRPGPRGIGAACACHPRCAGKPGRGCCGLRSGCRSARRPRPRGRGQAMSFSLAQRCASSRNGSGATAAALAALLLVGGCAATAVDGNFESARRFANQQLGSDLAWLRSDESRRAAAAEVERLLAAPLGADDAVRIALAYSPALQALLYQRAASSAAATQSARLPNPVFTFERLVRNEAGGRDLDIGRMLGIPLGSLLLLPARMRLADFRQQQTRLQLAGDAAEAAIGARQAWVRAVAAQQSLRYVEQVKAAADASAELARRMQAVGNFSKLQRAREQAFAADAVAQLARARQAVRARPARRWCARSA